MRKTTTLTALIAAGALAVGGVALAPAALAATADDGASSTTENHERRGPGAGHGPGGGPGGERGERGEHRGAAIEIVLDTLGITADELRDARQDGTSLAELAEAQGVDVATLIDALVSAAEERIAEHVADGDLTQEEADERLAEVEERITDRVNGEVPERGDGERRMHGHGGQQG